MLREIKLNALQLSLAGNAKAAVDFANDRYNAVLSTILAGEGIEKAVLKEIKDNTLFVEVDE